MDRIDRRYVIRVRQAVQWGIFTLIIYGGWRFYLFVQHFESGAPLIRRPPLVDAFLPIGSLMSLKLFLTSGIFDPIHPAGLVIFTSALLMSMLLKKSFCGWVCPVGALSEPLYKLGAKMFGRNFRIHPYLDYPLRSLKYLLMGFFLFVVLFQMKNWMIVAFLGSPYWKVADVKMLAFFTDMTELTAWVLLALVVLSIPFKNFWCRYLCPYGALVGLLSYISPWKITRNEEACTHCHRCTMNCPSLLPVEESKRITSPECMGCLTCVSQCPAQGALEIATPKRHVLKPLVFSALVLALLFVPVAMGKITGHWESAVAYEEYKQLVPKSETLAHP